MRGKLLCAALALQVLSCRDSAPEAMRPRGIAPGEEGHAPPVAQPAPAPAPPPPPPSSLASPFATKLDPGALTRREPEDAGLAPGRPEAPVPDAGKPRDLSSELLDKLGRPTDCIDLAKAVAAGGRVNIVVVAEVMPSGRITRAQASAADQPASALRCLENKVTSAGLKGPVPGAPLSVTATLPIEVASQPTQR
jgi:hypothetical protein